MMGYIPGKALGDAMSIRAMNSIAGAFVVLALSSCGGGPAVANSPAPLPAADPSCSGFTADPSSIQTGASSKLSWSCGNASVSIDNGIGAVNAVDTKTVSPPSTTTYTLTATGNGKTITKTTTITVTAPPPPKWTIGSGSFTSLQFTAAIPTADQAYITNLYNWAYPRAVALLGPPPDTAVLTVDLCSWSNISTTHTICVATLPTATGADQNSWQRLFLTEFAGLFGISQHTGMGANWINEAWESFGGEMLMREHGLSGQAFFMNELDYEPMQLAGKEIVGGMNGKAFRGVAGAIFLDQASGEDAFLMLAATQSMGTAGDPTAYTFWKDVKAAAYTIANQCQCQLTQDNFLEAIRQVQTSQTLEGLLADEWLAKQAVAYTQGTPGVYLYVYASSSVNPGWLEAVCFQRLGEASIDPNGKKEIPCGSGTISGTISSATGSVTPFNVDLAQASREFAFNTASLASGAYRIQASGTANGVAVTSPDSYFGKFDSTLVPFPQSLGTLGNAMFLIGKNADGTPSAKALPAPTGGAAGKFLQNGNGVAVWQVSGTTIPQPEYTANGRRLYVPLSFSPVFVVDNP
jgi:hypothetical protein